MAPWTPFRELFGFDPFANMRSLFNVNYDVGRTDTGYDVEIPVPGYAPSDIELTYTDGLVTISGKNDRRSFTQSFTVPDDIEPDKTDAKVEYGMLRLQFERRPEAQPKRINVSKS